MSEYRRDDTASWDAQEVRRAQGERRPAPAHRTQSHTRRWRRRNPVLNIGGYLIFVLLASAILAGVGWMLGSDFCAFNRGGLELDIIPMDFDGVLNELAAGSVDLGMAGLSPDPERADAMDFSDIYYMGGQSFVCLQSNKDQFTSLEDTNKPELSIGAQNGSIQKDLADQNSPDADIVVLTKVTDIVAELLAGKLDGAYIETAVAETYAKQYPDLCVVLDVPYDSEGSAIGVSKGNDSLMAKVNEAIAAALADGSMDNFVAEANDLASGDTASLVDGEIVADEK